jgi:hypothetical protein
MNKLLFSALATVLISGLAGCASQGYGYGGGYGNTWSRHSSALTGAALGGAGGALLGGAVTRDGGGALVGGALGAAVGGVVGNSMDNRREAQSYQNGYYGGGRRDGYRYPDQNYRY